MHDLAACFSLNGRMQDWRGLCSRTSVGARRAFVHFFSCKLCLFVVFNACWFGTCRASVQRSEVDYVYEWLCERSTFMTWMWTDCACVSLFTGSDCTSLGQTLRQSCDNIVSAVNQNADNIVSATCQGLRNAVSNAAKSGVSPSAG